MARASTLGNTFNSTVQQLVSKGLGLQDLKSLSAMLEIIARSTNSYGCVLWELLPGSDLDAEPPRGGLFVLDHWLADGRPYLFHDLPLESAAGRSVLTGEPVHTENATSEYTTVKDPRYLQNLGIQCLLAVPIFFADEKRKGAITLYRKEPLQFSVSQIRDVQYLALMVPPLYQSMRVKAIYGLTKHVNQALNKVNIRAKLKPDSHVQSEEFISSTKVAFHNALATICSQISSAFQCVETSIFLEDRTAVPGKYELVATTWPEEFAKTSYELNEKSLTSWVLSRRRPVAIFDLAKFDRDRETLRKKYQNLSWTDSLDIKSSIRRILKIKNEDPLPPLSFMAAPLLIGETVLGAIRCCTVKKGPFYFAEADQSLLTLIADQVARHWSNWLNEIVVQEENLAWQRFSENITELNAFVLQELRRPRPNEELIFDESLKVTNQAIRGADILSVRLLNRDSGELEIAATRGAEWRLGNAQKIKDRKEVRFEVGEQNIPSIAERVLSTAAVHAVLDIRKEADDLDRSLFPHTTQVIGAPIISEADVIGVLEIRSTKKRSFPRNAIPMAGLLGRQLGLYHYLAVTIGKLKRAEKEQIQTLEDLAHQLRSPIVQAHVRAQSVLRDYAIPDDLASGLYALRGLSRKAKRVVTNTAMFSALARGKSIEPNLGRLDSEYFIRLLIETASDNQLLTDSNRNIRLNVNRKSFEILRRIDIRVDQDLLEQAVNNILDNASKYSYSGTTVEIVGGLMKNGNFYVSVSNQGLPLRSNEISRVILRGWRSPLAEMTTGEGSGIGLWIVNEIMQLHRGQLQIFPTSGDKRTEFRLVFPAS